MAALPGRLIFKYIQTQHIKANSSLAYSRGKNKKYFLYLGQVEQGHSTSNTVTVTVLFKMCMDQNQYYYKVIVFNAETNAFAVKFCFIYK
jgi:hypothetical protein